ncbi:MAG: membrane protein [Saprospiraceae bacterium]|nr:MAG: membrane protein [Saprospiraceae bacterium]
MLWTAFTIGLFGSLHCVGMCGPIALALPYQKQSRLYGVWKVLLYNLGRTTTYVFLGVLIGLLGEGLFLAGMQRWLSIGIGITLLVIALFSIPVESRLLQSPMIGRFFLSLKTSLGKLLNKDASSNFFKIGLLNGFLPCGLVYMAIVGALTMGSIQGGATYMLLFGLGTIPLMLGTALAGQMAGFRIRNQLKRLYPIFLIALAILFIFRGAQFDLPADFSFWNAMQNIPMCY